MPVKRELSEDFFKAFAKRSNSLTQLEKKIGLPNIDEPMYWYCYYEISDDRYVECQFHGDNIEQFSVVDSKDKLYILYGGKK